MPGTFNYKILRPVLIRYARRSGHPDPEAFVQEVFFRALNRPYEDRGLRVSTYLHVISRNMMADYYRRRRIRTVEMSKADEVRSPRVPRWFENEDVRFAVSELPIRWREVLWLRYWEDLPIQEVGRIMHLTQNGVKALRHRAIGGLRLKLRNTGSILNRKGR